MRTTTPISYSTSAVGSSTFSRWHTANSRRSPSSTFSTASSVPGRPALIGTATPGNTTVSRIGSTGSFSLSAIRLLQALADAAPADAAEDGHAAVGRLL
jgi:hypothetical protein